jgi:hypothetical protein
MTPEGKVKQKVKKLLALYGIFPAAKAGAFPELANGWYFMPSATQYGVKGIPDFLGSYRGRAWGVETKAPGKIPTGFQALQISAMRQAGHTVFVIDGDTSEFEEWLKI